MKKLTKQKIFFDGEGNLWIPKNIKFSGELTPPLTPREWFFLLIMTSDMSKLPPERKGRIKKSFIGSRSTFYRIRKSLIKKGYLKDETKLY